MLQAAGEDGAAPHQPLISGKEQGGEKRENFPPQGTVGSEPGKNPAVVHLYTTTHSRGVCSPHLSMVKIITISQVTDVGSGKEQWLVPWAMYFLRYLLLRQRLAENFTATGAFSQLTSMFKKGP